MPEMINIPVDRSVRHVKLRREQKRQHRMQRTERDVKTVNNQAASKPIQTYYEALKSYGAQGVEHEGALETAFQRLLADTARLKNWTLIPKLKLKVGGKTIFPDGTLRDDFNLPRGYWEAKDTDDDLDEEIGKKIAKGYPLTNTIFEDTRQAVLYQNGAGGPAVSTSPIPSNSATC